MRQLIAFVYAMTHWRALLAEFEDALRLVREAGAAVREANAQAEGFRSYALGMKAVLNKYQRVLPDALRLELMYLGSHENHVEKARQAMAAALEQAAQPGALEERKTP